MELLFELAATILKWIRRGLSWLTGLFNRIWAYITGENHGDTLESTDNINVEPAKPPMRTIPAATTEPTNDPDSAQDDETALARMLASEDKADDVQVIVGWIAAQRTKKGTLYKFLTGGDGYGPHDRREQGQGIKYASTAKPPTASTRRIARGILDGTLRPSAEIRKHKPGGWVERKQGISDESIFKKQKSWGEGLYAQIANSQWVLFSSDTPAKALKSGQTATQLLDSLPIVPALDRQSSNKVA